MRRLHNEPLLERRSRDDDDPKGESCNDGPDEAVPFVDFVDQRLSREKAAYWNAFTSVVPYPMGDKRLGFNVLWKLNHDRLKVLEERLSTF